MERRPRRWSTIVQLGLIGLLTGCSARSQPYEIEGRWVGPVVRPARDLAYVDIEPGSKGDTIVLVSELVLRIRNGVPYVLLGMGAPGGVRVGNPRGYAAVSSGEFFAYSGTRMDQWFEDDPADNAIVRHDARGWEALPLPIEPSEGEPWFFGQLIAFDDRLYAVVHRANPLTRIPTETPFEEPPWRSRLYRWDNPTWTDVSPPSSDQVIIVNACSFSSKELLTAGRRYLEPLDDGAPGVEGYLASYTAASGTWREETAAVPATDAIRWTLGHLACDRDGRAWASVHYGSPDTTKTMFGYLGRTALYVRDNGGWHRIDDLPILLENPSPKGTSYVTISALAVDGESNVWLAEHGDPQRVPRLWKYDGKTWDPFDVPAPQGYKPLYPVEDLLFDHTGEGWAIANVFGGVVDPRHTPVLMHYRDGKWQLRGWSWHFWQQRWFGLPYLIGNDYN